MHRLSPINMGGMFSQPIASPAARMSTGDRRKSVSTSWEERFQELKQFKVEKGHCLVPGRCKENPSLGRWVESQRKQYRQYIEAKESGSANGGPMNADRVALLEGVGFAWTVRKGSTKKKPGYRKSGLTWEQRLGQLRAYRQCNGDSNVPYHFEHEPQLGRWVANQRTQYQLYMKAKNSQDPTTTYSSMTEERIVALEAIGFEWNPPRVGKRKSMSPGSAPLPLPATETYTNQPAWAMDDGGDDDDDGFMPPADDEAPVEEPAKKKHKASRAPIKKRAPRKKKTPSEKKPPRGDFGNKENKRKVWNERFEELQEYKKQHGNCNVPGRCTDNYTLGRWVETQRKQYHNYMKAKQEGKTDSYNYAIAMDEEDRIAKLEGIGFAWAVRGGSKDKPATSEKTKPLSWNERLEQLKAYKEANGNCNVPNTYPQEPKLGIWVANQRTWYRLYMKAKENEKQDFVQSAVKEERICILEALGFEWLPSRKSEQSKPKMKSNGKRKSKRTDGKRKSKKAKTADSGEAADSDNAADSDRAADGNKAADSDHVAAETEQESAADRVQAAAETAKEPAAAFQQVEV